MSFTPNTDSNRTSVIQQKHIDSLFKNMGHVPSTVKPLKALKNTSGLNNELKASVEFHKEGCPLLISSALLRSRFLGQIDIARIQKDHEGWILEIGEVKSSQTGHEMTIRGQRTRLFAAQKFLSGLFGHRSKLINLIEKK